MDNNIPAQVLLGDQGGVIPSDQEMLEGWTALYQKLGCSIDFPRVLPSRNSIMPWLIPVVPFNFSTLYQYFKEKFPTFYYSEHYFLKAEKSLQGLRRSEGPYFVRSAGKFTKGQKLPDYASLQSFSGLGDMSLVEYMLLAAYFLEIRGEYLDKQEKIGALPIANTDEEEIVYGGVSVCGYTQTVAKVQLVPTVCFTTPAQSKLSFHILFSIPSPENLSLHFRKVLYVRDAHSVT